MTDFVFKFRLQYSDLVERGLYDYDGDSLDAPDHAFQCKSLGQLTCLLCKTTLGMPLPSTEDLDEHLQSSIHLKSCDIEAFNSYHNIFVQLNEDDQYLQVYFSPLKLNVVYCDTCLEEVHQENILPHAISASHLQLLREHWVHTAIIETNRSLEEVPLDYSKLTHYDVLPHRLQRLVFVNSPLIIQKVGTVNFCVLCRKDIESLEQHFESKKHQRIAERISPFQSLWHFHNYWINQPVQDHYKRKYFQPAGFREVKCILCRNSIPYSKISSHLASRCRSLDELDPLWEPELNHMVVPDIKMTYSSDIKMMFYPNDLMQKLRGDEHLQMFTIQRQLENTQCLLCQEILEGVMTCGEVIAHVKSRAHQSKLKNDMYTKPLVAYHAFWMRQTLKFQAKQQFFRPCTKDTVHCWKCLQKCRFAEISTHLDVCRRNSAESSHSSRSSSEDLMQTAKKPYTWDTASNFKDCIELEEVNSSVQISESYLDPQIQTLRKIPVELKFFDSSVKFKGNDVMGQVNVNKLGADDCDYVKSDSSVNNPVKFKAHPHVRVFWGAEQENKIGVPAKVIKYGPQVMKTVYPLINSKKKKKRPSGYYLQKRSRFECYCLYCNTLIVEKGGRHVEDKNHLKNVDSVEVRKQFEAYHKFWMAQPPNKQLLQIYFNPHIPNFFLCVTCNKPVSVQDAIAHPCLLLQNKCERFAVPEEYETFEMRYRERIRKKFFSNTFLAASKMLLNSEMPFGMQFETKAVCYLCGNRILRNLQYWFKHLLEHCSNMEFVRTRLPYILQFHQFWEQQSGDWQICMIHYVPDFKGALKCVKRHELTYDQIYEHTENCPIQDLNKLAKLCDDVTPQSANFQQSPARIKRESASDQVNSDDESHSALNRSFSSDACDKLDENCDSGSEYGASLSESANGTDDDVLIEKAEVDSPYTEDAMSNRINLNPAERALMKEIDKIGKGTLTWAEAGIPKATDSAKMVKSKYVDPYLPGTSREIETDDPVEVKEYDNETICTLYPNFNSINRARRPTIYFLQKRSNIERFCLLCCCPVIGIPVEHTRGKKHLQSCANLNAQNRMASYHDFWMSQPPEKQLLQVNFNPYSLNGFFCLVCKKPVAIQDVNRHPCLLIRNKYERFEVPEEYRKFEMKYNDKISKRFFSKSFLEVSKTVLNSEMPFGLHFQGKAVCFLCGKRIFRDLGFWHKHLLEHCAKMNEVLVRLHYILQYHKFWEQQFPDLQICMVHYVPDYRGAMKCAKQHVVFYDQAFIHTKKCPILDWDKLVKLCNNDDTPESTIAQESPRKQKSASVERLNSGGESDGVINGSSSSDAGNKLKSLIKDENCNTSESDGDVSFTETANGAEASAPVKKKMVLKETEETRTGDANLTPAERAVMAEIMRKLDKFVINLLGENHKKVHNVIPSIDEQSDFVFDLLPFRFKSELSNLTIKDKAIYCDRCNTSCGTPTETMFHLISGRHLTMTKTKYRKREYHCDVCKQKFGNETEWMCHIGSEYHKLFCEKFKKSYATALREYECLTCQCVFFGDKKCALIHKQQKNKKHEITLKRDVKELFKDENTTERVALTLRNDILLDEQRDAKLAGECLKGFEDALKKVYPKCRAYPFGSRVTGIGNSESDLDVFIDIGDMYFDSTNQKTQQDIVLKVKKILSENRKKFSDICAITHARTPIIRVVHNNTYIDCDLSFRHGLSVENTKFISFCFDLQPVTRLAMLTLKRWADMIDLKDEITSYALCMMFIFYMQLNEYLISVQKLRELTNEHVPTIDDWEVIDYTKSAPELIDHVKMYDGTVFNLLKGFFLMYSEFEFEKKVVCPLLGREILVKNFDNKGETLPPEMAKFSTRLKSDPECEFKISAMCVQDPFDLAHNLTKAIFKSYREKYRTLCRLTYAHMQL